MPSGLKRFQKAASLHFITFSCFHRLPLLDTPGALETVEAVLEQARARHYARVAKHAEFRLHHVGTKLNERELGSWRNCERSASRRRVSSSAA
jgi:putative transposase